jgi:hypothetical protein
MKVRYVDVHGHRVLVGRLDFDVHLAKESSEARAVKSDGDCLFLRDRELRVRRHEGKPLELGGARQGDSPGRCRHRGILEPQFAVRREGELGVDRVKLFSEDVALK